MTAPGRKVPKQSLVAVLSAADTLFFGLCADRDAVDDLDVVADGIRVSLRDLAAPVAKG